MATPTLPQTLSDARYSVIADLGRGETVDRTASFLVMNGWDEADALWFVQLMKNALDAHEVPPKPWDVEGGLYPPTAEEYQEEGNLSELPPQPDEEDHEVREPTAEEFRLKRARRAMEVSISNMKTGGLWILGGAGITFMGYIAASEAGGRYLVFTGAIIYGAVRFFVGYGGYRKAKKEGVSLVPIPELRN